MENRTATATWRGPIAPMIVSWVGAVLVGAIAPFFVLIALVGHDPTILAVFLALAVLMALMAIYVGRDALGKRPWRVDIAGSDLTVDLPAARSLIHNPPACQRTLPAGDVGQIQARTELYRGLLSAQAHRAYRLLLKDGSDIFLFEERAVGTRMATPSLDRVAAEIAGRLKVPYADLGTAEGRGGVLGAVLGRAPDWSAPALPPDARRRAWTRVQLTGLVALAALAAVVVIMAMI